MKQAIGMNISGIKCDTQDCDYQDMSVKVEDYADWINKPCPKCGGNLLTQTDYDNTQMMINLVNMMNGILPPTNNEEDMAVLNVDMNGTGKVNMIIGKYEE